MTDTVSRPTGAPSSRASEQAARRTRRTAPTRLVGELEQTVTAPDGSVVVNRADLREQVPRRPPHPYGDFVVLSTATALRLATEFSVQPGREMRTKDFRVLLYLIGVVEFANFVPMSQGAISKALHIDKADVSRSLKKLVEIGVLHLDRLTVRPGVPRRFHLANSLVWKGSTHDLSAVQDRERREASPVTRVRRRRDAERAEFVARRAAAASARPQDDPAASLPSREP